jgi:protein-arginine kinase activator protein McsA
MSLYNRIIEETRNQMPQQSIYGVDMSIAFKLLCDEVDKLQKIFPAVLEEKECIGCYTMFKPQAASDVFCGGCSEEYMQCGCRQDEGCLCYAR